jgi:hypothetical protein
MTLSIKIKELMSKMPDTMNTKKEVDDFYKDAMKKCMEKTKEINDNKPKKELNGYQKFMKENIKPLKEANPKLTGREVFSTIAIMWKKQNETNAAGVEGATGAAVGKVKKGATVAKVTAVATVVPAEEEDTEVSVDKVKEADVVTEVTEVTAAASAAEVKDVKDVKKKDKKAK